MTSALRELCGATKTAAWPGLVRLTKCADVDDLPPPRHITNPLAAVSAVDDDRSKALAEMIALVKENKEQIRRDLDSKETLGPAAAHALVDTPQGDRFRQQFDQASALDYASTAGQVGAMTGRLLLPKKLKYQLPAAIVQQATGTYNRQTDAPRRTATHLALGTRPGNHVLVEAGAQAAPYAKYAPYLTAAMEQPIEDIVDYARQIEDPALRAAIRGIAANRRNQEHHQHSGWTEEALHGVSTIGSAFSPWLAAPTYIATGVDAGRAVNDVHGMNRFWGNPYGEAVHFYSSPKWEQGLRHWADSGTSATIGEYVSDLKNPEYRKFMEAVEARRFLRRHGTFQAPKPDVHGTIFDPEAAKHVSPETMVRRTRTLGDPRQRALDDAGLYFELQSPEESRYPDENAYLRRTGKFGK